MKMDFPTEWLVDGLICKGQLTLLYGKQKSGKTTFLANMLSAVCDGKDFIGRKTKQCNVLYWTFEENERVAQVRNEKCGLSEKIQWCFAKSKLSDQSVLDELKDEIKKRDIGLLVIDPLVRAFSIGDEWKQESVSKELEKLFPIRDELNVAIVLVAHSNKRDTSANGSVQFEAIGDMNIHFKATPDRKAITLDWVGRADVGMGTLKITGTDTGKYEIVNGGPGIKLNTTPFAKQKPSLTDREKDMLKCLSEPKTKQELAKKLGLSATTVKSTLSKLKGKGHIQLPGKKGRQQLFARAA